MMASDELLNALRGLPFSAALSDAVILQISHASQSVQHAAGTHVFREGSEHDLLYLVRSGVVALEINMPGRPPTRILTLGPGDLFGWSALLGTGPMVASAVVLEDLEAVAISGKALRQICDASPEVGYPLMRQLAVALSRRLVATRLQLLDLFHDTAPDINPDVEAAT
jgi:CRP-like cAMP-binding protein